MEHHLNMFQDLMKMERKESTITKLTHTIIVEFWQRKSEIKVFQSLFTWERHRYKITITRFKLRGETAFGMNYTKHEKRKDGVGAEISSFQSIRKIFILSCEFNLVGMSIAYYMQRLDLESLS